MRFALAALLFVGCFCFSNSQVTAEEPPGLTVGKKVPDFILNDQNGKKQKLSALLKEGPVAVVFHRSANW